MFVRDDTLMAQPFDPTILQLSGAAFTVADRVSMGQNTGGGRFSVSASGVLAYGLVSPRPPMRFAWVDRSGNRAAGVEVMAFQAAVDSSDRRLALARMDPLGRLIDVWIQSDQDGLPSKFTFGPRPGWNYPVWSPAGDAVAFVTNNNPGESAYEIRRKGMESPHREDVLFTTDDLVYLWDWSPDGRAVVIGRARELWRVPVDGQGGPKALTSSASLEEVYAQVSPNGRWLAYSVEENGREQVYVQGVPPAGGRWLVTPDGGSMPRWRRDGKALYYRGPDARLRMVTVIGAGIGDESSGFEHRGVEVLPVSVAAPGNVAAFVYHVSADGQRFLVGRPVEADLQPTTVVLNWQAGAKR
ncbi:MAG: hypothetical protein ACT4QD_00745 [Acidobacteriota bacterium]